MYKRVVYRTNEDDLLFVLENNSDPVVDILLGLRRRLSILMFSTSFGEASNTIMFRLTVDRELSMTYKEILEKDLGVQVQIENSKPIVYVELMKN